MYFKPPVAASVALMAATVPLRVTVLLLLAQMPSAPELAATPRPLATLVKSVNEPLDCVSVTVTLVLSTSATCRPVIAIPPAASSLPLIELVVALTGASLTAATVTIPFVAAVIESSPVSMMVTVNVRWPAVGLSESRF